MWALKAEDRRKLETTHHRFLRAMLKISIHDVKEAHIKNSQIREELDNCYTLHQNMELRRARWLEKLAYMTESRNPRKILVAWTSTPRPTGRPQQTIRHSYAQTLENGLHTSSKLKEWMPLARDHRKWSETVELALELKPKTYKPYKHRT